jgi:hypothetical protein
VGVSISDGSNDLIGGTAAGAGNVIAGNAADGVLILGPGNNTLQGNWIGTNAGGSPFVGNGTNGVNVEGAGNNLIGGTTAGAGNTISGNGINGILLASDNNTVAGNSIGVAPAGYYAVGNSISGLSITSGTGNTIGGLTAGARNVISGNGVNGISINSAGNLVEGNWIGLDTTGTNALANHFGVYIAGTGNTIGGTVDGAGNVISGNADGLDFYGNFNTVQGNRIGTDPSGTTAIGNDYGVYISGTGNVIGGTTAGASNVISGNNVDGIYLSGINGAPVGTDNVIQGNLIGTDATGTVGLGNTQDGIYLSQADHNTIGSTDPAAGNVISANGGSGIDLQSGSTNLIQGNAIGTDITVTNPLGNAQDGVYVAGSNNTIGGTVAGAGNVIRYNNLDGIVVDKETGNAIQQNSIGLNGGLGIHLINGGNANAAAPVLTAVTVADGTTVLDGTLTSTPSTTFTIELFVNVDCNPSGYGDGETYLGSVTVTTDANGFGHFKYKAPSVLDSGQFLSATATDAQNNTSGFAQCLPIP